MSEFDKKIFLVTFSISGPEEEINRAKDLCIGGEVTLKMMASSEAARVGPPEYFSPNFDKENLVMNEYTGLLCNITTAFLASLNAALRLKKKLSKDESLKINAGLKRIQPYDVSMKKDISSEFNKTMMVFYLQPNLKAS